MTSRPDPVQQRLDYTRYQAVIIGGPEADRVRACHEEFERFRQVIVDLVRDTTDASRDFDMGRLLATLDQLRVAEETARQAIMYPKTSLYGAENRAENVMLTRNGE